HRVGDVAWADRAVKLAAVAGLTDQDEGFSVELLTDDFGFLLLLEIARFELRFLSLEIVAIGLCGAQRLLLRQEKVAGEAVLHLHFVAHLAELFDAFKQYHLHGTLTSEHKEEAPCSARA